MRVYIGQIEMFAGNFPPAGWAFCNGSLLQISDYELLYNLIGITYGGDGETTFALPNLCGRTPVGTGKLKDKDGKILDTMEIGEKRSGAKAKPTQGEPHATLPPYLGTNFIISLEGEYPSPA